MGYTRATSLLRNEISHVPYSGNFTRLGLGLFSLQQGELKYQLTIPGGASSSRINSLYQVVLVRGADVRRGVVVAQAQAQALGGS